MNHQMKSYNCAENFLNLLKRIQENEGREWSAKDNKMYSSKFVKVSSKTKRRMYGT